MLTVHRQELAPLERRAAPLPQLPSFASLLAAAEEEQLRGIGFFARAKRRDAKAVARRNAEATAQRLLAEAQQAQAAGQARLDATWARLLENDEDAVLPVLEAAFRDNEAPVAAVGADGPVVSIAVLVPAEDVLPVRAPAVTAAGNVSLRVATKGQSAEWYRQLVAGHVLVSVRETLATAPGATAVTVVAVRHTAAGFEPVLAARFDREKLACAPLATKDAWAIVEQESLELRVRQKGAAKALQPLDLTSEPELQTLLHAFDVEESG